ncbi:hypothetical protein PC116_g28544 [Phytophthora cactorum]|nr:hypothetical protein PC116_g28544 [Phytophthora cactorum]
MPTEDKRLTEKPRVNFIYKGSQVELNAADNPRPSPAQATTRIMDELTYSGFGAPFDPDTQDKARPSERSS